MKNSIPSDVWEKKRALIAKLYKDEEWPLKQVIKQIRSEDFNPRYVFCHLLSAQCQPTNLSSETQLRSRLKKWRVTKPSRQTRKKSQETTADDSDPDDFSKDHSSTTSSTPRPSSQPAAKETLNPEVDWHPVSLDEQDLSGAWVHPHHPHHPHHPRNLSHSPSVMHQFPPSMIPSSSSYDPSQPSTPVDGVLLNPSSSMAPYSSPSYTVASDVCLPQSTAAPTSAITSVPWSIPPPWFPNPLDGVSPQAFYTTTPSLGSPVAGSPEQSIPPPPGRVYSPRSMTYQGVLPHGVMPDFLGDPKPWRRAMSLQTENVAGGNEARKYFERKASMPAKTPTSNNTPNAFDLVNFSNAQPPMMCAPIYPYPEQESLMHKVPASIGF